MGFFDDKKIFRPQGGIAPQLNRLNARYKAIIEGNLAHIEGKRILDIASYNGRWSYAAFTNKAKQVVGVELRQPYVNEANKNFTDLNVPKDRYSFECSDVHEYIPQLVPNTFDTIFCLGFLYHTPHHFWLIQQMAKHQPEAIVVDTQVYKSQQTTVHYNYKPKYGLQGLPTVKTLKLMFHREGYEIAKRFPYGKLKNKKNISDYTCGGRVTLTFQKGKKPFEPDRKGTLI